jgi:hypothetical protein
MLKTTAVGGFRPNPPIRNGVCLLKFLGRSAIRDEEPPVSVTGSGVLDVTIWRQKDSLTVHLVDLKNPMMMKGSVREIAAVAGQRVRLRLPAGMQAEAVHLLVLGADTSHSIQSGVLEMALPRIGLHEVISVDLTRA